MNLDYYLRKILGKIICFIFHYQTKGVFQTVPIGHFSQDNAIILLSMLQETDVQMYLLAAKSMMRYVSINKVVIVCDPTLTEDSKAIIQKHICNVVFLEAREYQHDQIPSGGCWERLYAISHLTSDYYVIQMDADILTLQSPSEIIEAAQLNHPFILGTKPQYLQLPIEEMCEIMFQWLEKFRARNIKPSIQVIAENVMAKLIKPLGYKYYTRGCAGFAGFHKGGITPELVLKVSQFFYDELGEQWENWGSEQFVSNLLLSNLDDLQILPTEKYNVSDSYTSDFVLAHFIGTFRFSNMLYTKLARQVLVELRL